MCFTWSLGVMGELTSTDTGTTAPFSAMSGDLELDQPAAVLQRSCPEKSLQGSLDRLLRSEGLRHCR